MHKDNIVRGVVCYFKNESEKQFGFIQVEGMPKNVYFHMSRQVCFLCDGGDTPAMFHSTGLIPEVGDEVIFALDMSDARGPRAKYWGFAEEFDQAKEAIEGRPQVRFMWRLGRKKISRLHESPEIRKLWEGRNLRELRAAYPIGAYPMMDNGHTARYFERWNGQEWVPLDTDPRINNNGKPNPACDVPASV